MTTSRKTILAISGSLREHSSNSQILKWIGTILPPDFEYTIYSELGNLPHFNPGIGEDPAVQRFREQLMNSALVLMCTPEYAFGVPGSLKNALDWTVSGDEMGNKPVALITASLSGTKVHESLLNTFTALQANVIEQGTLIIPFVRSKITNDGRITDEETEAAIQKVVNAIVTFLNALN